VENLLNCQELCYCESMSITSLKQNVIYFVTFDVKACSKSLSGFSWQNCNVQGLLNYIQGSNDINSRNTWKLVLKLLTSLDQVCTNNLLKVW